MATRKSGRKKRASGATPRLRPARRRAIYKELTWDEIREPGAYVDLRNGDLFRIPREGLTRSSGPLIVKESVQPARLVQLTNNPFITSLEARQRAAAVMEDPTLHERVSSGGGGVAYEDWSREELYERAQELSVEGRSRMSKEELIEALRG